MQMYTLDAQLQLFKLASGPSSQYAPAGKAALIDLDATHMPIAPTSILQPETIHQVGHYAAVFTAQLIAYRRSLTTANCSPKVRVSLVVRGVYHSCRFVSSGSEVSCLGS